MKAVRMFGPINSTSGYGNAVRNFAEAFALSDIPIQFRFAEKRMKYVSSFKQHNGATNIDFYLHCPPYTKHKSKNYKIGYFYWEAETLPHHWRRDIKVLDEIWAPCRLVEQACRKAGFKKKIRIVPTPIRPFSLDDKVDIKSNFSEKYILSDKVFKFYSIFQWHERKGYKELLKAYLSEFSEDDNVILILKVNPLNVNGYTSENINNDILKIKSFIKNKNPPMIFLSKSIVHRSYINGLHSIGDCYVAPHHGEGWGMPIHDAMWAGKQVITTQFGGVTEYLDNKSAHLIDFDLKPVTGMEWSSLYGTYQKWAYPKVHSLRRLMRDVYENKDAYKEKGIRACKIAKEMDIKSISKIINKELK